MRSIPSTRAQIPASLCSAGVRGSVSGIELDGALEVLHRHHRLHRHVDLLVNAAQVLFLCARIDTARRLEQLRFARKDAYADFRRDGTRDVALQRQYVIQLALVAFRPHLTIGIRVDQTDADANPLVLSEELRGYLDTRLDVDLLRWTGETASYNIVVRADGLPLVWRLPDGKPRTPGAATVELHRGDLIRIERTDRGGKGALAGRDAQWSVVVTK